MNAPTSSRTAGGRAEETRAKGEGTRPPPAPRRRRVPELPGHPPRQRAAAQPPPLQVLHRRSPQRDRRSSRGGSPKQGPLEKLLSFWIFFSNFCGSSPGNFPNWNCSLWKQKLQMPSYNWHRSDKITCHLQTVFSGPGVLVDVIFLKQPAAFFKIECWFEQKLLQGHPKKLRFISKFLTPNLRLFPSY